MLVKIFIRTKLNGATREGLIYPWRGTSAIKFIVLTSNQVSWQVVFVFGKECEPGLEELASSARPGWKADNKCGKESGQWVKKYGRSTPVIVHT